MTPKEVESIYIARMKRIEFEEKNNNRRTARICSILANINRNRKKQPKPFTEDDFMPVAPKKERKKQSINDMNTVLKMLTLMNDGEIKK